MSKRNPADTDSLMDTLISLDQASQTLEVLGALIREIRQRLEQGAVAGCAGAPFGPSLDTVPSPENRVLH